MCKKTLLIALLSCLFATSSFSQTTEVSIKIGNNGNLSLNNKFKSGNYTELNQFGNGYQGAVEIKRNFFRYFGLKAEASYLNSNLQIDHESFWPAEGKERDNKKIFYEEIFVNNSSFNFSTSAVLNLGPVKLGFGPEVSYLVQSVGRGSRYYYSDSLNRNVSHPVQYRFFSKRKQVYNLNNPDEKHAYDVNRIIYGLNTNISILVYKPFSLEFKTFFPLTDFVEDFLGFENQSLSQTSINAQVSIVYTIDLHSQKRYRTKKRNHKVKPLRQKRFSSARLK